MVGARNAMLAEYRQQTCDTLGPNTVFRYAFDLGERISREDLHIVYSNGQHGTACPLRSVARHSGHQ